MHNGLAIAKVPGSFMRERMAIVNLAFHSLAGIDDQSCETLEYIKQEFAMAFQIIINTAEKSFKELSARQNSFAMSFLDDKQMRALLKLLLMKKYGENMYSKFFY